MSNNVAAQLECMWATESLHVRRMLIGLTRDIDLADDLLQETYLKARDGLQSYRGENDRAWLCAIARNAYMTHCRRRYVSAEILNDDDCGASYSPVGTPDHIELMRVRKALTELNSDLRTALLMKHYCGFAYNEIAESTHCPVGTAKWRVSAAIGKLKKALGDLEEQTKMTCKDLSRIRILDYASGALAPNEMEAVERHIKDCPICKNLLDETSRIISGLDGLENDMRTVAIIEIDGEGVGKLYGFAQFAFDERTVEPVMDFCASKCCPFEYLGTEGEELAFTRKDNTDPNYPDTYAYHVTVPQSFADGKMHSLITVCRIEGHDAIREENGTWTYRHGQLTSVERDWAYVLAIRLPTGASMISAQPPAAETMGYAGTTLLWRTVQAANQGFEVNVRYKLDN